MADQNYELAPRPGMTASQRRQELDSARFVAVRNLAYMIYKKPDGTPLMTYQETLEDRERVKQVIIAHEIGIGAVVNDGGGQPVQAMPAQVQPAVGPAAMMPTAAVPYGAPQMTPVAPATPAQAAQAGVPAPQPAPDAGAPTGRRRRAAAAQPQTGAPAPAPLPAITPAATPQSAAPGLPVPATAGAVMHAPQGVYATPQATQAVQAASADLSEVIRRLDDIGRGLSQVSKDVDNLTQRVVLMEAVLGKVNVNSLQTFASLHHLYSTNPSLAPSLQKEGVGTLDQFRAYLTPKYTGNP